MSVDDASHAEYIETFAWQLVQCVCSSLDSANSEMSFAPHFVADESMRHMRHAQACALVFHASAASRKMSTTVDTFMASSGRSCSALCVYGPTGCGKSMFVAENYIRLSRDMHATYFQNANRLKEIQKATDAAKEASASLSKFKEIGHQVTKTLEALRSSPFVYVSSIPAIIIRFIGLTSESSSIRNLISSICQQMHMILVATHGPTSSNIPPLPPLFDLESMKAFFRNMLKTWSNGRLILFLDGVDHLDDSDSGRTLDWLPVDGLSAMVRSSITCTSPLAIQSFDTRSQVRVIITTSSTVSEDDEKQAEDKLKAEAATVHYSSHSLPKAASYALDTDNTSIDCFTILKGRITRAMMVEFPVIEEHNLLQHMLALHGRTLGEEQCQVLLQALRRFPRLQAPIVASILVQNVVDWPSYKPIPNTFASSGDKDPENAFFDCRSVSALCRQLFQRMEERHGRHLVHTTLAYITLTRFGVSESELFELLSLSDDVLAEV